jgi:hypothetical protein
MNSAIPDTARLADIHLPNAIHWFPPAIGWWLVIAVVVLSAIIGIGLWRRNRKQKAYRQEALTELASVAEIASDHQLAQQLNTLLRRVAMQSYSPQQVAALSGDSWAAFLSQDGLISPTQADKLSNAAYNPSAKLADRQTLLAEIRCWLRKHRGGQHV